MDWASDDTLTQVRGYRSNEHESVRQTGVPGPHSRPLPARRSAAQAAHPRRVLRHCGYHRKSALRLLQRPLPVPTARARPGPKLTYDPAVLLPVLKVILLASDQLCSKLLKAGLPEWLDHYERQHAPLPDAVKAKLLAISPAQIDRLLRPARVGQSKKGLSATRPGTLLRHQVPTRGGPADTCKPGTVAVDTVAHCDDTTAGD